MDKSEITKLPKGMSSEELDRFTTNEDAEQTDETLAQEALDATATDTKAESSDTPAEESVADDTATDETKTEGSEEKSSDEKKPDVDPKDAVIGDFRRRLRDQEIETARLEGELEARKSIATKAEEPEKSPLEIAEAAWLADPENEDSLEGFAMTGKLYRKQREFDKVADEKAVATVSKQQVNSASIQTEGELQEGDLSSEKMGQGLDLKTVAGIGTQYLTRGDRLDIADMVETHGNRTALKEAYRIMVRRTLAAGNEDSKLLRNAINIKGKIKSNSQSKPKKEPTDIDALTTEGDDTDTGGAETETHNTKLTDFVFRPD